MLHFWVSYIPQLKVTFPRYAFPTSSVGNTIYWRNTDKTYLKFQDSPSCFWQQKKPIYATKLDRNVCCWTQVLTGLFRILFFIFIQAFFALYFFYRNKIICAIQIQALACENSLVADLVRTLFLVLYISSRFCWDLQQLQIIICKSSNEWSNDFY